MRKEFLKNFFLGAMGCGICGAFPFVAGISTTVTNMGIIYTSSPIFIILLSIFLFKDKISLDLMEKAYINLLQDYKNNWKGYWTSMNIDNKGEIKSINIFDTEDYDKIQKCIINLRIIYCFNLLIIIPTLQKNTISENFLYVYFINDGCTKKLCV